MASVKTLFVITIMTARMIFPGLHPSIGNTPNARPPAIRSMTMDLSSDVKTTKSSTAWVTVPSNLKVGPSALLVIDDSPVQSLFDDNKPGETRQTKTFAYWGCGETVAAGQPKIITSKTANTAPDDTTPNASYAYWPGDNAKPISNDASTPGIYKLTTNYAGSTTVTLGKDQDFLDPVDIDDLGSKIDLTKPIVIKWKAIPNALGYVVKVYGGTSDSVITWNSGSDSDSIPGIEYNPVSKEDVEKYLKNGVLLPPDKISCTIPAGIFKGSANVVLMITAVGRDTIQTDQGVDTQVVVRSTASLPLYSEVNLNKPRKSE